MLPSVHQAIMMHLGRILPMRAKRDAYTHTSYYDNTDWPWFPDCNTANGGPGWADPTNHGVAACGRSVADLGTNAAVALNVTWLNEMGYATRADRCGLE